MLSLITPAFNEEANLPLLYERLKQVVARIPGEDWEWIVVDDHSRDQTFQVLKTLAAKDPRVRGLRLARNCGSHAAITCGLHHARGDAALIFAADLQDPPEVFPQLIARWREGFATVWAVREHVEGGGSPNGAFGRLYYFIMRRIVGFKEMPSEGADFFLIDRKVIDAFKQFNESQVSLFALVAWMGFSQASVPYRKAERAHGRSGWSFERKFKLVIDSVTAFTYLPIRMMSYGGVIFAFLGFTYAGWVVINYLRGNPTQGWSSLMVAVLTVGGAQMMMMGILGEYLWRALEESRRRPRFIIESFTESSSDAKGGPVPLPRVSGL